MRGWPGRESTAGSPRSADGNGDGTATPDIGAFELQPPPTPPAPQTPPVAQPPVVAPPITPAGAGPAILSASLTHRRFRVGKHATTFRIKLSKAARVKIAIKRATLKRAAHKGANRIAFSGRVGGKRLKPGRYVATITATDTAGHRSKPRRLRFSVRAG